MKQLQLLTSQDAKPRKKQHTKPCSDCPFARRSLRGWLGSHSAIWWMQLAHGEGTSNCHTTTNQRCAGLAIYRANVCKVPRDPEALQLPRNRKLVFASMAEFLLHHNKK